MYTTTENTARTNMSVYVTTVSSRDRMWSTTAKQNHQSTVTSTDGTTADSYAHRSLSRPALTP
jgi:hypothetical protein